MEKVCMAMGKYDSIAALRIRQSLRKTNDNEKLRGGPGRRVNAVMLTDSVHHLEQAADLFAQVAFSPSSASCESAFLDQIKLFKGSNKCYGRQNLCAEVGHDRYDGAQRGTVYICDILHQFHRSLCADLDSWGMLSASSPALPSSMCSLIHYQHGSCER